MNVPAIETRGLQKRYDNVLAVDGIDLNVARGEIFGLVGADGAGKTTTIQMLCTLTASSAGEARVLGLDTIRQAGAIKAKIGYVSERFSLYPTLTVEENLDFFARLRGVPRDLAEPRKKELLGFCRLEPFRKRPAEQLSGGMQKKLALACSLINEPEVVFLDEPTTGVDPVSRRDFWAIMSRFLVRGVTVLVSTPYLDEAERFNRVAFMHQGHIIACDTPQHLREGVPGEVLEIRASSVRQVQNLLAQRPGLNSSQLFGESLHLMVDSAERRAPELRDFLAQHGIAVEGIRRTEASLEDAFVAVLAGVAEKPSPHQAQSPPAVSAVTADDIALTVTDLTRKFGSFTAVDHVNFEVERGKIFGLLGPNGSGKTTTIRMIIGLLSPTSGTARLLGQDISTADVIRHRIGYMSQKFSLYADLTVEENINLYGGLYGLSRAQLAEGKQRVLDMAGLRGKERRRPFELSGGWKRRLALGCAIIHHPEVVFLDEPTAGVDPLSRRSFWELIQELAAQGTTIFVTTHYMDEAEHCDQIGMFHQGRLIALGTPFQLKTERVRGEMAEIAVSDHAQALGILTADARYRQANLFGSTIHITVANVAAASPEIRWLLESGGVSIRSINRMPFNMEDVFIALVEEQDKAGSAGKGGT